MFPSLADGLNRSEWLRIPIEPESILQGLGIAGFNIKLTAKHLVSLWPDGAGRLDHSAGVKLRG